MKVLRAAILAIVAALMLLGGATPANADSSHAIRHATPSTYASDPSDPGFPPND
jgi:hypothetical protein